MLEKNKIDIKIKMRQRWEKTDNPTTQLALYRLLCTSDEHRKLNQQYLEMKADIKQEQRLSDDQINKLVDKL
jgi:hypothetical protein